MSTHKSKFGPDRPPKVRQSDDGNRPSTLHVVGDTFGEFAFWHDEVITRTELEQKLAAESRKELEAQVLLLGQGLPREAIEPLRARLEALGMEVEVLPPPAGRQATHKLKAVNRLISNPAQIGPDQYVLDLVIDERTADLADHTTGEHIAGMVLLEASRQALLAVWEARRPQDAQPYVIVLHDVEAVWKSFVFPLPVRIYVSVRKEGDLEQGDATFVAEMRFHQADKRPAALMTWRYSAYSACFLATVEVRKASQALHKAGQLRIQTDETKK